MTHPMLSVVLPRRIAGSGLCIALLRTASAELSPTAYKVAGVLGTATHIAFKTYSRADIEGAFSIGE